MLILNRRIGERIVVDGQTKIVVLRISGNSVKLGIAAPSNVSVNREEIQDKIRWPHLTERF